MALSVICQKIFYFILFMLFKIDQHTKVKLKLGGKVKPLDPMFVLFLVFCFFYTH